MSCSSIERRFIRESFPSSGQILSTFGRLFRGYVSGSYAGESDHRIHFGLGDATTVEKLEIRWLSGRTQVLQNVPANQILTVREPK